MNLAAFSISLSVKDLSASRIFYELLGFEPIGGNASDGWLILKNRDRVIGLFQGMLERNTLTFNPGWDQNGNDTEAFTDIRAIEAELKLSGTEPMQSVAEGTMGPGRLVIIDPDGNPILIDQHRA